jgi:C_GCAxxG_C_C family probable redox protein
MDKSKQAAEYMKSGYNCAQSIVKAYAGEVGLEEEDVLRMAAPFGGGLGRNGYVCGALTGAALIIGKKYGNVDATDARSKEKAYHVVSDLLDEFAKGQGSVMCRELTSTDMRNPEELKKAREAGIFSNQCPLYVMKAGELLEKALKGE